MAGQQKLQISLEFNANTRQAKVQLQELQNQLTSTISTHSNARLGITPQIQEAVRSAMDLKIALQNATNVNTGKLNLNKFQSELNRSGKSIQHYGQQLALLGPQGVKAFSEMAQAIAQADTRLFSLQGGMKKLATTFANTARWQLTSSIIMGITSSISETVSYAKELDESLTNIRVVTGKSADQMARFAKAANESAKALSTSTKAYADASLIYFQQGLNDKEVKERTDVTVKLANVVGASAREASEWMTAIWNNFDNGSESLEYYADVLTKLGAATASSADEIAGGLEKFAAVAETIGLSYEYAASALATITAQTRQSEDVVGTALKTIFSRMEQLKQGDSLDDGTTLGQYSLALQTIGVDIKDASGELKDMDTILEQTGARWQTLARDQQIALAQSVAGIRQYTQFMALMDNWDFMQSNLELTEQANGALAEQQRIYEEGTKAAQERFKASTEAIKATLLGGDDLTKIYNFGSGALEIINDLLEAFGGLPTILMAVATALTKVYQPQIASFFSQAAIGAKDLWTNLRHPIKAMKGENVSSGQQFKLDTLKTARNMMVSNTSDREGSAAIRLASAEADAQISLVENSQKLNASVKQRMEWQLKILHDKRAEIELIEEAIEKTRKQQSVAMSDAEDAGATPAEVLAMAKAGEQSGQLKGNLSLMSAKLSQAKGVDMTKMGASDKAALATSLEGNLTALKTSASELGIEFGTDGVAGVKALEDAIDALKNNSGVDIEELLKKVAQLKKELYGTGEEGSSGTVGQALEGKMTEIREARSGVTSLEGIDGRTTDLDKISKGLKGVNSKKLGKEDKERLKSLKQRAQALKDERKAILESNKSEAEKKRLLKENTKQTRALGTEIGKFTKKVKSGAKITEDLEEGLTKTGESSEQLAEEQVAAGEATKDLEKSFKDVEDAAENGGAGFTHWSDKLASGLSGLTSYVMGLNMLSSAFSSLSESLASGDASMSDWISSISSVLMSLGMLVPVITQVSTGVYNMAKAKQQEKIAQDALTAATAAGVAQDEASVIIDKIQHGASKQEIEDEHGEAGAKVLNAYAENAKNAGKGPVGWAMFAAGLAMIAPVAVMVGSAISGASAGATQKKQEETDKGIENLQAIDENQELAGTVSDLTKEYNKLRNAGESTADVLSKMEDEIPNLIDSYKELAKTLGTKIDVTGLEEAYQIFQETGDITVFQRKQEEIDQQIAETERTTAETTKNNAIDLVMNKAREGDGGKYGNKFVVGIGDWNADDTKEGNKYFNKYLGDYWDESSGQLSFDMTNEAEIIDAYNKMVETRNAMIADGVDPEKNDFLRELTREINEMSENMPALIEAQGKLFEIDKAAALKDEDAFMTEVGLDKVKNLEEYKNKRQELINTLMEEKQWTEEQAEAYLKASKAYGQYESTIDFFGEGGLANFKKGTSQETINEIQDWFMSLPEEDRTLAMTIDYSVVGSVEEAEKALEEARIKAEKASIRKEALALGVDEAEFNMYSQMLANTNEHLDENSVLTDQVALAHYKLNKGLSTLSENWDKNFKILKKSTSVTPEYAKALGEVSKALEEAFGVPVSASFIQDNLSEIEKIANGDTEALQGLQDKLAEDYVLNMEIGRLSINDNVAVDVEKARNTLMEMLNSFDTSIEIGEGTTISQDYLDTIQQMLDAGQITEDQLQKMMQAKGFEFEITEWKEVPGPKKTITRTNLTTGESETIEESELMRVPVINGQDETIKADGTTETTQVATARAVRSTSASSINFSQSEKKLEQQKSNKEEIEKLKEEKNKYQDITDALEAMEKQLDRIAKKKERAWGKDKLKYIEQEKKSLQEQIKLQKEYVQGLQNEVHAQNAQMTGYGFTFGVYGNITNYDEIYDKMLQRYAEGKDQAGTDEEELEKWETWWTNFEDNVQKYRDNVELLGDESDKLDDIINEALDKDYEALEYTIEFQVEISEVALKGIDFRLKEIENNAYAAAEAMVEFGKQIDNAVDNFDANKSSLTEWLKLKGVTNQEDIDRFFAGDVSVLDGIDVSAKDMEFLNTVLDNMIESYDQITESITSAADAMDAWVEELNSDFENLNNNLQHITDSIDGFRNIVELIGPSSLGVTDQVFLDMLDNQLLIVNKQADVAKASYEKNKQIKESTEIAYKQAIADGNTLLAQELKESLETYTELEQESFQNWLDLTASSAEIANQRRDQAIQNSIKDFLKETTGFSSMDELQQVYDQQRQIQELYVADYEKAYQLSKLSRQLDKSMNDMTNIRGKQKLLELEEKINKAKQSGVKMSSYELANLEREYQLELAKIALEEAQNTKSKVRLVQNAEGGMSYLYTADQTALNDAQQKYEDAVYNTQKANDEWLKSCEEGLLSATATYIEQMAVINSATYESEEERNEAIKRLNDWYIAQQKFYTGQIDIVLSNNAELHEEHMTTMENQNFDFITDFKDTFVGGLKEGLNNAEGYYRNLTVAIGDYNSETGFMGDIKRAQDAWKSNTQIITDAIGDYFVGEDGQSGVYGAISDVNTELGKLANQDFNGILTNLSTLGSTGTAHLKNLKDTITTIVNGYDRIAAEQKAEEEKALEEDKKAAMRKVTYWLTGIESNTWDAEHVRLAQAVGLNQLTDGDAVYEWYQDEAGTNPYKTAIDNNTISSWDRVHVGPVGADGKETYVDKTSADNGRTASQIADEEPRDVTVRTGDGSTTTTLTDTRVVHNGTELNWYDEPDAPQSTRKPFNGEEAWPDKATVVSIETGPDGIGSGLVVELENGKQKFFYTSEYSANRKNVGPDPSWGSDEANFIGKTVYVDANEDGNDFDQPWLDETVFLSSDSAPYPRYKVTRDLSKLNGEVELKDVATGTTKTVTLDSKTKLQKDTRPEVPLIDFDQGEENDASWWSEYAWNGQAQTAKYHADDTFFDYWYVVTAISPKSTTLTDTGKTDYLYELKETAYSKYHNSLENASGMELGSEMTTRTTYISAAGLAQALGKSKTELFKSYYEPTQYTWYDTGGYTGEWGPEGRIAMLHQKEIVLNAHDTENILSVVDMVRQMATQLDFNALAMANGLGNLVANTMIPMPQTIDQNVTITAEFPNVTSREEIKEAFGDLVNLAAQYASRR